MAEQNIPGVIAQARAAAPTAVPAQPVAQPAPVTQPAPVQQGFNAPAPQSGFAPQPAPAPEPVQQPVQPVAADTDRTRQQFEKLTDSNQRLAQTNELLQQELRRLQQGQQARQQQQQQQQFGQQQQQAQQQPSQQVTQVAAPQLDDYIQTNPATGERFIDEPRYRTDLQKFNASLADVYQKASRAEQVVQNFVQTAEQRELARQEREMFQTYPELNPNGGLFNQRFSQQTRAMVYDSLINPHEYGGRSLSLREAADFVAKGGVQQPTPAIPTPTVNQANQVQKEQAAATVPNVPQQVSQAIDADREYARLVQGTRLGADEAIAIRLLNATHKLEDVEKQGR